MWYCEVPWIFDAPAGDQIDATEIADSRAGKRNSHTRISAAGYVTFRSTVSQVVSQVAQHLGQGHFRVSRLESALHRGLGPALRLRIAHALSEEIGIATKVLGRRKRDRIDPILDRDTASGRDPAIRWASDLTKSLSLSAGSARLIQP
jgi:hypothetical protein